MLKFEDKYNALSASFSAQKEPQYVVTSALSGKKYDGGLMVVGRAVNSWRDENRFTLSEIRETEGLLWHKLLEEQKRAECPMQWLSDSWSIPQKDKYNAKRSAFWRVAKDIQEKLHFVPQNCDDWPSYLTWSNLYKIAPSDGGNPSWPQCELQQADCIDIFMQELVTYRPKILLLMTGYSWAEPFIKKLASDVYQFTDCCVEAVVTFSIEAQEYQAIITKRPEGKKHHIFVEAILDRSAIFNKPITQ